MSSEDKDSGSPFEMPGVLGATIASVAGSLESASASADTAGQYMELADGQVEEKVSLLRDMIYTALAMAQALNEELEEKGKGKE